MKKKTRQIIKNAIKEYRKFHKRRYPKHYLLFRILINKLKYIFDNCDKFYYKIDIFFSKQYFLITLVPYDIRLFIDYKYLFNIMIRTQYTDGVTRANVFTYKEFKDKFNELLNDIDNEFIV